MKKHGCEKGNASWITELPSVFKNDKSAVHDSKRILLIEASEKVNETTVFSNLRDKKKKHKTKSELGGLVRTAVTKKVLSKSNSTNYSYNLYTVNQVIHKTKTSYRSNYLPESYNENFFRPAQLTLEKKHSSNESTKFNSIKKPFKWN